MNVVMTARLSMEMVVAETGGIRSVVGLQERVWGDPIQHLVLVGLLGTHTSWTRPPFEVAEFPLYTSHHHIRMYACSTVRGVIVQLRH